MTNKTMIEVHPSLIPYEERVVKGLLSRSVNDNLVSYKYTDTCDHDKLWDEYTRQARGIIFNKDTGEVVARPFSKFFNLGAMPETMTQNLPDIPYKVYDKVDGSLGILYWHNDEPYIATCGSFFSDQAVEATKMLKDKYRSLEHFNKEVTLLFEIIYPENKIVCDYGDRRELVLLAAFNRITGLEYPRGYVLATAEYYNMPVVDVFNNTIEEMIELKKTIPKDQEGFIVRYYNGFRVKIKGDEYLKLHRIVSGITPLNIWAVMETGAVKQEYLDQIPEDLLSQVRDIEFKLKSNYDNIYSEVQQELCEYFHDIKMTVPMEKEQLKIIGLRIKELGSKLKHGSFMFPYFLQKQDAIDGYIMKQIRPTGNRI